MKCPKCGTELRDGAKFCPACGAAVEAAGTGRGQTEGAPSAPAPEGGAPRGRKRRGMGLIVAGGVAVAAVAAVAVVAVSGLLASPKDKAEKAFNRTVAAFAEARESMGLPDLQQLSERQSVTQRLSLELAGINDQLAGYAGYDLSFLKGLGLRMSTDWDGAGRKLASELAAYWDGEDILSAQLLAEDSALYLSVPQFTGDEFCGVNTETLGADLADLTGDDTLEDISFNLFDLIDIATPSGDTRAEMEQAMEQAAQKLLESMEVEKAGSETIDVNGRNTDADAYDVLIPQDAMEDYADAVLDTLQTVDYVELYEELLRAMGVPRDQIDQAMSMMGGNPYRQLSDLLGMALDELGDLELTAYVSGGYLSALVYDHRGVEIGLYLGGGEEYVDDVSLELSVDDSRVIVESSGDHGGRSGVFTDETVIRVQVGGETVARVTSEFSYEPKAEDGNLLWEISVDDMGSLNLEGQLTAAGDSLSLVLEDISVRAAGMELFALEAEYYVGPCEGIELSADGARMILEMSEPELMEWAMDLEREAQDWLYDMEELLYGRLPQELLWSLMYSFY